MTTVKPDDKVDAWMPLWIGAYLADTMSLSRDSHGGYLLLLFAYWRNKGPLPDDDEDMCGITKATPAEWKKLRPRLVKFFTVEDGFWIHGRADEELKKAGAHKAAAVSKAKAGANARWKDHQKHAPRNAPSMPGALPEQSPTPTPLPTDPENTHLDPSSVGGDGWIEEFPDPVPQPTQAGALCRKLRLAGVANTNPGHPALLALLQAGATEAEFLGAAPTALNKGDAFAYVLGTVTRQRQAAANLVLHQGELPATETPYQRSMRERMEQAVPAIAAKRPGAAANQNPMEALDELVRISSR